MFIPGGIGSAIPGLLLPRHCWRNPPLHICDSGCHKDLGWPLSLKRQWGCPASRNASNRSGNARKLGVRYRCYGLELAEWGGYPYNRKI